MLYREIMAVCSEIHTKHRNTVCVKNVELLNVKLAVHIVTTGLWSINDKFIYRIQIKTDVRLFGLHIWYAEYNLPRVRERVESYPFTSRTPLIE